MVIPIILLGEARDRHLLDALRSLLGERCAWQTREGIFWKEGAAVMLLDLPASSWVDAGGGLVVLKESFLLQHLPEHLLHARCILPDQGGEALLRCGLPCIAQGEHLFSLPSNLSAYEMLCCAAVLLLLGMEK